MNRDAPNTLPEATVRTCGECPWRRSSAPGWLGPFTAQQWLYLVHGEEPIACHETIVDDDDDWDNGTIRQCHGAAQYRRNVAKKPLNPEIAVCEHRDTSDVFATPSEFLTHHERVTV